MATRANTFDFRLAVRERERAIRLIEAMLNRSARSGEELDLEMLDWLQARVAGLESHVTVVLPEEQPD